MLVFKDDVTAWNAVDVLVDGLLQHGHVINVAEGGLIIDFGCATQRAQFVEYGRIFNGQYKDNWKDDMLVLLPRTDGAWVWYPGQVVSLGDCDYDGAQCVEVQRPHGPVRELVHWPQLRAPPTKEDLEGMLRVAPGDFVIRSCPLPGAYWADGSQRLGELFKYRLKDEHAVVCKSLLSQTFLYLQCRTATPLDAESAKFEFDEARDDIDSGYLPQTGEWMRWQGAITTPKKKRKVSGQRQLRRLPLPPELLVEIFHSLDSIGRLRCRRVCHAWNTLLTTDTYFPDVRVSGGEAEYTDGEFEDDGLYWLISCLLKCLNSTTKVVVINQMIGEECTKSAGLIRHLLNGHRLAALVFYDCEFGEMCESMKQVTGDVVAMTHDFVAYERMVLKKCRVYDYILKGILVTQHSFGSQSSEAMRRELWQVVEKSLNLTQPLDRPAVAEWIADCIQNQRSEDIQRHLVNALNSYQRADPRSGTEYRGRKWTTATLADLDASKLTTLTAAALSESVRRNRNAGSGDFADSGSNESNE
ncbi:uncharacterized protein LOC129596637 [Paramacrobiotus metropolitanus]|uniref:uncharacterized protein LOC129596637 n=1 Tax=Paramacrobiotus metropolitanus TaxID=2943436 RepID=UPI002445AD34|nr:uncharacterized protein LOC129596637 [Paramacrobiotus metropolitanus]XP_055349947.1 uncharacterized protein LOC129596637 [Paramacrobiotus metropolitanus]